MLLSLSSAEISLGPPHSGDGHLMTTNRTAYYITSIEKSYDQEGEPHNIQEKEKQK